ncbi:15624_t:CDS:10 [Funneliformis mosseae]|uniref:RING-type E3 ubiquitin transferase n=1 Tax=Funneliformis mosseae TaxID=27381 RepID=A0A9N8WE18_FUNMO|nr:15624_t:CDS:10 [Funneliformis mosseae]
MPDTIPIVLFLRRGIRRLYGLIQIWFRALLVGIVWLVALPWVTVWIWRAYFLSGEFLAFLINGQKPPTRTSDNNTESGEKSGLSIIYLGLLKGFIWYVPPEAVAFVEYYGDLASKVLSDTFEGQIITCVVVIVFVAAFLLREWIVQNTPAANENNNVNEQINDEPANERNDNNDNNAIVLPNLQVLPEVEQIPVQPLGNNEEPQIPNLNEGAFVFQNGHRLPLIQQEPQFPTDPALQEPIQRQNVQALMNLHRYVEERNKEDNIDRLLIEDHTIVQEDQFESKIIDSKLDDSIDDIGSSSTYNKEHSPLDSELNVRNLNIDDQKPSMYVPYVDDSKASIGTIMGDANNENSKGKNIETNDSTMIFPESNDPPSSTELQCESIKDQNSLQFRISNSVSDKNKKGTNDLIAASSSSSSGVAVRQGQSSNAKPFLDNFVEDRRIRPIRQVRTRMAVPMSSDASSNVMRQLSTSSQEDFDELSLGGSFMNIDYSEISNSDQENEDINLQEKYPRDINNTYSPSKIITNTSGVYFADDSSSFAVHRNSNANLQGYVEEPNANNADAPALPAIPAPIFNEAIEPPANSVLMIILIALCLAGSIWVPFFVGKTVLLIKPLNIIQLPLKLLRKVTDPVVDLVIDTGIPWLWSLVFPLLKSGWSATSPQISQIFEDSIFVNYMQGISDKTEDLLGYAATFVAKIDPPESVIVVNSTISGVNQFSEFLKARNLTWLVTIIDRWNGFAYGNAPTDKIVCILCGYTVIIVLCAYYLAKTRNAYGATVGRAVQEGLRQQGIVLKVAFFVAIELIIFPIICGILLDLSTLPLFAEATPTSRLEFYFESPITSTFLHWFTGTAFMFHFAVFVSLCREIVRSGVMWFIRDPNDPQFHPIKEILDRPVWTQLKKIGASGIMYSAMIVCGLGSVIYFIRYCFNGILPLQLSFTEPISDFPADLLVFHIVVPVTVTWAKPKRLFRKLFENWWKVTSRTLRLTSFMFGDRHFDEEGTHVRRTWGASLRRLKARIPNPGDNIINEYAEVVFVKDGELVRAPSYDGVPVVPGRRMLIPVNEDGTLKNPDDAPVGQDDQLNYTIVYIPPNFKARVITFLFLMWFCGSLFCCSVTILPLLTGRYIFKSILHHQRAVHDLYAFTVGLYVLWALYISLEWVISKIQAIAGQDLNIDWAMVRQKMWQGTIVIAKILYFILSFGIIIPFLLSLVTELYIILPWKKLTTDIPIISFLQDWALGIVYMKIAYRIVFMLPDNIYSRAINDITERGFRDLNVKLATTVFIIPIGGSALAAVILPALTAWLIISAAGISNANSIALLIRYIYPVFLAIVLGYRVQRQMGQLVHSWMQAVRDEEYLIGRRLHNIDPNERGNTNVIIRGQ